MIETNIESMGEIAMARIMQKECRTALNRCAIPGMDYCLNPYTGCTHACVYCYASFMKRFCGIGDKWGSFVQIKVNFADRLASQLRRAKPGRVTLSSVTDPYQPVERQYQLTRSCLELLVDRELPVSILTKSDLVLRDLPILKRLPRVEVGFTITSADPAVAHLLEPGAPDPERRFIALAKLAEAGIDTWIFIAPVIPGVADTEANLASILERAAQAGVREVNYDSLNFYPTAVSNLMALFRTHWPGLLPGFRADCADHAVYHDRLRSLAETLWPAYGFQLAG
jgi:DNA repair photolyase